MIENRTSVGKSAEDFIRLQDLWGMFFQKWYWFALSLFVALATASLYLLSTLMSIPGQQPFWLKMTPRTILRQVQ